MEHSHSSEPVVYNDELFGKASPGKIGMWLFLMTDGMSFSGLLLAYAVLRANKEWPNPAQYLGIELSELKRALRVCRWDAVIFWRVVTFPCNVGSAPSSLAT